LIGGVGIVEEISHAVLRAFRSVATSDFVVSFTAASQAVGFTDVDAVGYRWPDSATEVCGGRGPTIYRNDEEG
jgi:hypothetical protein